MWRTSWNNLVKPLCLLVFMLVALTGCSSESIAYSDHLSNPTMIKQIEAQYQIWRNTPYQYGGNSLKGIDCSSLVMNFYNKKLGKSIPRVTTEQAKVGFEVTQLKAGDLVFFKTGHGRTGLHVGIYYKNGLFLHVSTSKGVKYSNLHENYWRSHYWMAKRVIK